jgi:hypothetical protein
MGRVLGESDATGAKAQAVRDMASLLGDKVGELKGTLTRIMRTSSDDADRRAAKRHACHLKARIAGSSGTVDTTVANISTTGILLGERVEMRRGAEVRVDLPGPGWSLKAVVVGHSGHGTHLRLNEDCRLSEEEVEREALRSAPAIIDMAREGHRAFVERVTRAVSGGEPLRASELPDHMGCRFGRWYEAMDDDRITGLISYRKIADPHARVHEAAKRALQCHLDRDAQGSHAAMVTMKAAASEMGTCLDALDRDLRRSAGSAKTA